PSVSLILYEYIVDDSNGNNDGIIDPGETVDIIVTLKNNGDITAENIEGTISTTSPYLTIVTGNANFGNLSQGETGNGTYTVTADINTPVGQPAEIDLDVTSNSGTYTNSYMMSFVIGQINVLIIDLDGNHNSGPVIQTSIEANGISVEYITSFPADLNIYTSAFVCLGVYSDNHVLSSSEGQALADFLNNGGMLYMEGAETWFYDPTTAVHTMFNINPEADGTSDLGTILGQSGTFTEGMSFNYSGDNSWIDHISAISPAFLILENQSPVYGTGIAYNAGTYKTIGASHEFGGLDDGSSPSTKTELMYEYLEFFGLGQDPPEIEVTPLYFSVTLSQDETTDEILQISNIGEANLTYNTAVNYTDKSAWYNPDFKLGNTEKNYVTSTKKDICPFKQVNYSYPEASGDILMEFDIQSPTGDDQIMGCGYDGTNLWFTGGGNSGTNMLYKFDISGNLLNSYSQGTSSSWGMRDMAFDGTYLYAGDNNGFYRINPSDGNVTTLFTSTLGISVIRALAYNPGSGHFYAANWDTQIVEFDAGGTQHATYTAPGLTGMYGLGYDEINDVLWIHNRTGTPETTFYEYDLNTQSLTGISIQVPLLTGLSGQLNGGAFYFTDLVPGKIILGGIAQGNPVDMYFAMELDDFINYSWLSVTNNGSGTVPGGNSVDITIHFDATGLDLGIYTGAVLVNSNDPDEPQVIVTCTLEVISGITVNLTAFLEGPFAGSYMSTFLNMLGFIPLTQPYNTLPWNYNGTESVASIPNSDIIDWVLIELRETTGDVSTATSSTMIDRQAGFILKDGTIVNTDGSSPLVFNVEITENLYAVVYHRNHLGILSANPLPLSGGVYIYNYTSGVGQVYGGLNGHKELEPGIWGMIGGDGNADGEINNLDKNDIWNQQRGNTGYYSGDF
ncbi:MAG: hypothetical protein K8R37_14645, partial [Bacteroidales bacterium]|nr:hypothetical protein [Bacteroidales bacterium]